MSVIQFFKNLFAKKSSTIYTLPKSTKELNHRTSLLISQYLNGTIDADEFRESFSKISRECSRLTQPDDDGVITMTPEIPINIIRFLGSSFHPWRQLEEMRISNPEKITPDMVDKYRSDFKQQCSQYLKLYPVNSFK